MGEGKERLMGGIRHPAPQVHRSSSCAPFGPKSLPQILGRDFQRHQVRASCSGGSGHLHRPTHRLSFCIFAGYLCCSWELLVAPLSAFGYSLGNCDSSSVRECGGFCAVVEDVGGTDWVKLGLLGLFPCCSLLPRHACILCLGRTLDKRPN